MAAPEKRPVYNCRLTKTTGDGEVCEVTFAAADQGELRTRLGNAGAVVQLRVDDHNTKVLALDAQVRAGVEAARDAILAKERDRLRAEVRAELEARYDLIPRVLGLERVGRDAEGGNGADAPAGPADVRPDP